MRAVAHPALLLALSGVTLSAQPAAPAADRLVGVWGTELTFGPALRGELTVRRDGAGWRAVIMSSEARAGAAGDSVRLRFPGGLGELRGRLADGGRAISGFWIQPAGVVTAYPFASPLTLALAGRDVWRGTVDPLPDRYSVYLAVHAAPGGALVGVFRNPERNHLGRWMRFRVTRARDSVVFATCARTCAEADTGPSAVRLAAALDAPDPRADGGDGPDESALARARLRLWWPPLGRTIELAPLTDSTAVGLYPRVPRGARYAYAPPPPTGDGWTPARAGAVGMDEAALAALVQRIADTTATEPRSPLIHSLLVARRGRLVLEEYFFGHGRDTPHDVRSVGKTFGSVMLGAAMMRGVRVSPESPVLPLLVGAGAVANPDARKSAITLAHLLTHTSGLACDDNEDGSPGNEGTMLGQARQPDYWRYTLDLPMAHDAGAHYAYCSGGSNLLGGALTRASGTWLPELFDRTVARPLRFGRYYFNLTPALEGYLGGGAYLRPRDLLKLGQTYLDGGVWDGTRVVPAAWVTRSTAKHVEWPARGENVSAGADGLAWHLHTLRARGREYRAYEANGNGGQLLIVVPEAGLVVVFTAGNYQWGGVWGRFRSELVPDAIIGAIRR